MKTKLKVLGAATALALATAGSAQAGIVVNDWTLDTTLATIQGGALDRVIADFDQMTFNGIARSVTDVTGGANPAAIDMGDFAAITVYGRVTAFVDNVTGIISTPELNSTVTVSGFTGWELSFVFTGTTQVTGFTVDDLDFRHIAGGTLKLYIDNLEDGGKAINGDASSFSNGTLVLTMTDDGLGSGNTDFSDLDGNDDAQFITTLANSLANLSGVFKRGTYDLGKEVGSDMHIDSNFDLDPDNNKAIDSTYGAFGNCDVTRASFCAEEDGSVRLSIPEPGTLALLGMGLMGFGAVQRRRNK